MNLDLVQKVTIKKEHIFYYFDEFPFKNNNEHRDLRCYNCGLLLNGVYCYIMKKLKNLLPDNFKHYCCRCNIAKKIVVNPYEIELVPFNDRLYLTDKKYSEVIFKIFNIIEEDYRISISSLNINRIYKFKDPDIRKFYSELINYILPKVI